MGYRQNLITLCENVCSLDGCQVKIQERMNAAKERGDTTEQMSEYGKLQKVSFHSNTIRSQTALITSQD